MGGGEHTLDLRLSLVRLRLCWDLWPLIFASVWSCTCLDMVLIGRGCSESSLALQFWFVGLRLNLPLWPLIWADSLSCHGLDLKLVGGGASLL